MKSSKSKVLLVHQSSGLVKNASTIDQHLSSFIKYIDAPIFSIDTAFNSNSKLIKKLSRNDFSHIILHYSLFGYQPFGIPKYLFDFLQNLSGKKIGWINCDRIISVDKPSELDVVLDDVNQDFTVRLVLSRKNAILPGLANSNSINQYKFSKIPSGESGYVLAYRESGEGYLLAYSQVTIGFIKSINLKPEYKTKEEFEKLIDSFLN